MNAIKNQLGKVLDTMNVPKFRKELNYDNLRWLARNLAINNTEHVDLPFAIHFIQTLLVMSNDGREQFGSHPNRE